MYKFYAADNKTLLSRTNLKKGTAVLLRQKVSHGSSFKNPSTKYLRFDHGSILTNFVFLNFLTFFLRCSDFLLKLQTEKYSY
jgi:hypothetical protein